MDLLNQNRNLVIGLVVVVVIGAAFLIIQSMNTISPTASSKPKALPAEARAEMLRQSSHGRR